MPVFSTAGITELILVVPEDEVDQCKELAMSETP